jgi:hypothetical protein
LCLLCILITVQIIHKDVLDILIDFRFYWGWLIFYFIFKKSKINNSTLSNILTILCLITLLETVLINTVIAPYELPNFPDYENGLTEWTATGMYQRPYSFGASATVGSSLLVVLMSMFNVTGWRLVLCIISIISFISGTGLVLLMMILFNRYKKYLLKSSIFLFIIFLFTSFYFKEIQISFIDRIQSKIGLDYIIVLIDLKFSSIISEYKNLDFFQLIFGNPDGFRGGDFGLLAFVLSNGIFGLTIFVTIIFSFTNKRNLLPMTFILLSSLHYPVIFFLPGQMLFGLILSLKYNFR